MYDRRCRPLTVAARAAVFTVAALLSLALTPQSHAQDTVTAVPEFIELTPADLEAPVVAEIADAQATFRSSLGEDPERALDAAKSIVALAVEAWGTSHANVSRALTNLAILQAERKDFDAAVENYNAAIDARERSSGSIVSGDLVNPLLGLADTYMALDRVDLAIPVYERAIHISTVRYGPNNIEQVGIVDALSNAYFFSGELDSADALQDTIFMLRKRQSGDNPDLYIDALEQRAGWHARLENYEEAARYYRRLTNAISDQYGKDDARLIEPLTMLANAVIQTHGRAFGARRIATAQGKRAMGRAVRIARKHADENPELFAKTLVWEGDFFNAMGAERDSWSPYREAWAILHVDPALHGTRDELFATPVRVSRPLMRDIYRVAEDETANPELYPDRGYVDAEFDVDQLGTVQNVRIVDASPAGLMDAHVRHQLTRFRFRPALEDGWPRPYAGLSYRHTFLYSASALTDRERNMIETTTYGTEAAPASVEVLPTP